MRLLRIIPLLCGLVVSGCHFGVQIQDFKPAHRPQGVTIELGLYPDLVAGNTMTGELLEVREEGLLLNVAANPKGAGNERRVVMVTYPAIKNDDIEQLGRSKIAAKRLKATSPNANEAAIKRDEQAREFLRLISRFPQGLSSELLADLLSAQGQESVEILSRE